MRKLHRLIGAVAVTFLLAGAYVPAAARTPAPRPQRIVSLNLCADQLLLALADRSQIAGLTRNADNAEMSAEAARARGLRIMGTSAEEILEIRPDLIIGMPARGHAAIRAIRQQRYRMVDLKPAETLQDIFASIRKVAAEVGHPARGELLIARMQRDLARIPRVGAGKVAAYYQRRGYMTGTGTLIDDIMRSVGLVNLAGRIGKPVLSQVSLEEMVVARPDFIIIERETERVADLGTEMLHHPALRDVARISVPQAWTVCGGPAYVAAVRSIADQVTRHPSRP